MFDWDLDYDSLVTRNASALRLADAEAPRRRETTPRARKIGRRLLIGVVAILMTFLSVSFVSPNLAMGIVELVSVGSMSASGAAETAMPAGLLAYDRQQFDRARQGLVRFSDDELLDFAGATQRILDGDNPLGAYTHDVLLLTWQEIERRDLLPPVPSLADRLRPS